MKVTVEGVITSIEQKAKDQGTKDEKKFTEVLLAQKGEKMQTKVRLPGHVGEQYTEFEVAEFTGNLLTWKTRDSVDMMITVEDR